MKHKTTAVDLTQGPLLKKIVLFVIPLMLMRWLQMLFSAADTIVVGRLVGDEALAAVGATAVIVQLIMWIFGGMSAGVSVGVAHDFGAGNIKDVEESIHTSMVTSVIIGIVLMALGYVLGRPALEMLNTPADIIDDSALYLNIYLIGVPAQLVYQFGAAVMRGLGDSQRPVLFLAFAGALNVVLNIISVAVFHMGIVGVALATAIAQYVSAIMMIVYMRRQDEQYRLKWDKLRIHGDKLWRIVRIGAPAALQGMLFSISDMAIQSAVNSLGALAVSGNAAALSIDGFIFIPMESMSQACTVFSGQNVGAKKFDRSKKVLLQCSLLAAAVGFIIGMIVLLLHKTLLGIYLPEAPEAVIFGSGRLSIVAGTCFLYGVLDVFFGDAQILWLIGASRNNLGCRYMRLPPCMGKVCFPAFYGYVPSLYGIPHCMGHMPYSRRRCDLHCCKQAHQSRGTQ